MGITICDRRINTNLTTNISVAHALGTAFCVYNSQFVYIHIGVSTVTLAAKDTLAILPWFQMIDPYQSLHIQQS